jgi:hypothetical protein
MGRDGYPAALPQRGNPATVAANAAALTKRRRESEGMSNSEGGQFVISGGTGSQNSVRQHDAAIVNGTADWQDDQGSCAN